MAVRCDDRQHPVDRLVGIEVAGHHGLGDVGEVVGGQDLFDLLPDPGHQQLVELAQQPPAAVGREQAAVDLVVRQAETLASGWG